MAESLINCFLSSDCAPQVLGQKKIAESYLVTESRDRIGGNITTCTNDEGFMWEEGPNSFQPGDPILRMTVSDPLPLFAHVSRACL